MRALSIRQPYAELILRGIKTAELRSRATSIVGERFYIYAPRTMATTPVWSDDLQVASPPAWMIELAAQMKLIEDLRSANLLTAGLPTGVIVGSAVIEKVTPPDPADASGMFRWHLVDVERAKRFRKPTRQPQPVWFKPF
jgi:hypothetical protein